MTRRRRPVGRPGSVAVIIPAHNEEGLLPASLAAVHTAAGHPGLEGTRVLVVVAADSCTDATPEVARRAGALTVAVRGRGAGAARAAAARAALGVLGGGDGVWIASTDADSVVPADWLDFHLSYAARGWDALVGTVVLDRHPADARRLTAVHQRLYEKSRPPGGCRGTTRTSTARTSGSPPGPTPTRAASLPCRSVRTTPWSVPSSGRATGSCAPPTAPSRRRAGSTPALAAGSASTWPAWPHRKPPEIRRDVGQRARNGRTCGRGGFDRGTMSPGARDRASGPGHADGAGGRYFSAGPGAVQRERRSAGRVFDSACGASAGVRPRQRVRVAVPARGADPEVPV